MHRVARQRLRRRLFDSYPQLVTAGLPAALAVPPLDIPPLASLPVSLLPMAERIRREAEQVTSHIVDFLGSGPALLGPEIDWQRDFKSGYRWPTVSYLELEVTRLNDESDAKVPWELSRGHHLLTLSRAARLFEDNRFANEFEAQLGAWLDANPPGVGINWANPMEVAIRAVNWVWAVRTLEAWRSIDADLRQRISSSLQTHARHIALNLEGSPYLRSNHFLADILGLLILGWALPADQAARGWFDTAHRHFEREIRTQVLPDGVGFEASTSYHGLSLEMFLLALHVGELGGRPFSHAYRSRLEKMLSFSAAIRQPCGRIPLFGDGDSGRILPAGFDRPPNLDPVLWLGAAALPGTRHLDSPPNEEVAWTFGLPAWSEVIRSVRAAEPPTAFRDGGFYVLKGGGVHAVVRCGGVGQNGNGGHSHNDQLSYVFADTRPLVVDSGTYAYSFDPDSRNRFRSTAAHNGVMIDSTEINPIRSDDLFSLPARARIRVEGWEDGPAFARLVATHDGYRRLSGRPLHRRTFVLEKATGRLNITDEITGSGVHEAVGRVHLAAKAEVQGRDNGGLLVALNGARFRISWWGVREVEVEDTLISDRYGVRERSLVIVAAVRGRLALRFGHCVERIESGPMPDADSVDDVR